MPMPKKDKLYHLLVRATRTLAGAPDATPPAVMIAELEAVTNRFYSSDAPLRDEVADA